MAAYSFRKIDLDNARDVSAFIDLPFRIYKGDEKWVPPLRLDMKRLLNKQKNPFFTHSNAAFFIVVDQAGHPVSRLVCLNNSRYNTYNNESTAFFYLFESENIPEASGMIFAAAAEWAAGQGLQKITGPRGFTPLDGLGLMVEGFQHNQIFGIPYNPPYYATLLEQAGFAPTKQILSGTIDRSIKVNPKIDLVADRVKERIGLKAVSFQTKKQIRDFWPVVLDLYNKAIEGTTDNYPLDAREAREMTLWMSWIANPKLIKIIEKDSTPVGFLIVYPDISNAVKSTRGSLFPFGWFKILSNSYSTRSININGIGIIEEYRGLGGTAILFSEMAKTLYQSRYTVGELIQVDSTNQRMLLEMSNFGVVFHKKHQMYQKIL